MKRVDYSEMFWNFLKPENVNIGFNPKMVFGEKFDVVHALLKPKESLAKHFHERGQGGQEVFCFYNGGNFKILLKDSEEIVKTSKPVYLNFQNNEIHGIQNLSSENLEFQVWSSPPFKVGEVKIIE